LFLVCFVVFWLLLQHKEKEKNWTKEQTAATHRV